MPRPFLLIPLFATASILLGTNGLMGTFIPIRANFESFPPVVLGLLGSAYYFGFMMGCLVSPKLIGRVGHIRVFSAYAAISACLALLSLVFIHPLLWIFFRVGTGLCFAGGFMVLESWLNMMAPPKGRGRLLALYRMVDVISVSLGNYLLIFLDPAEFVIFVVIGILYSFSLVPICAIRQPTPRLKKTRGQFNVLKAYKTSPLAVAGVFIAGLTNASFRALGPVFGQNTGMTTGEIATFINLMILGSLATQFPLGWLADRVNRRVAIFLATAGATLGAMMVSAATGHIESDIFYVMAGVFIFGAFSLPIYSLSIAHANDFAPDKDFVRLSATLLLVYSVAATMGPVLTIPFIGWFGPSGFFIYISLVHVIFMLFGIRRIVIGRIKPFGNKSRYFMHSRTSPALSGVARPVSQEQPKNKKLL